MSFIIYRGVKDMEKFDVTKYVMEVKGLKNVLEIVVFFYFCVKELTKQHSQLQLIPLKIRKLHETLMRFTESAYFGNFNIISLPVCADLKCLAVLSRLL
jgi:hypothetical protein